MSDAPKAMGINQNRYNPVRIVDNNGKVRVTRGAGDAVANALLGLSEQQVYDVACDNGLKEKADGYAARLNPGQVRMNIGNLLRGIIKKGESITVLGRKINKLDQAVSIKDKLAPPPKAPVAKAAKPEKVTKAVKAAPAEPKVDRVTKEVKLPRRGKTLKDRAADLNGTADTAALE